MLGGSMPEKSDTIEKITMAARDEFAEKGFEGARVDEIARKAGINKAMLYYHVGDKKALYALVIQEVIGRGAQLVSDAVGKASSPEDKLRAYIRVLFDMISANPQMPRIMMREIASGGKNLPEAFFLGLLKILSTVTGVTEEGFKQGVFIETIAPLVHIMTLGAVISVHTVSPVLCSMPQAPKEMQRIRSDVIEKIGEEIERLILRSVSVQTKPGGKK